eukprot:tig00020912_g15865.t1
MAFEDLKAAAKSALLKSARIAGTIGKDVVDSLTAMPALFHKPHVSVFIKSAQDGRVLTCRGFNTQLTVEEPSDPALHTWAITEDGFVQHLATGLVMDVCEGRYIPEGAKLIAYRPLGSANQRWFFTEEGFLVSSLGNLNRCADICEGVGPGLILWTKKMPHEYLLNQQWQAVPASPTLWCQRCRAMSRPGAVLCDTCRDPLPMAAQQQQQQQQPSGAGQRGAPAPAFELEGDDAREESAGEPPAADSAPEADPAPAPAPAEPEPEAGPEAGPGRARGGRRAPSLRRTRAAPRGGPEGGPEEEEEEEEAPGESPRPATPSAAPQPAPAPAPAEAASGSPRAAPAAVAAAAKPASSAAAAPARFEVEEGWELVDVR